MFFKHLKSGGIYEFMGVAVNEADMKTMVMYRPFIVETHDDGEQVAGNTNLLWLRPASEFFDGRFEPYVFLDHATTAEEFEDEPSQTIGEALEIKNRRTQ